MHNAILIDSNGQKWVYEGDIQGQPIWVQKDIGNPLAMSKQQATLIAECCKLSSDRILIERA